MKILCTLPILTLLSWLALQGARADDAADLQQVIDLASKNADPQTASQVAASVKENQTAIETIFKTYRSYLNQAVAGTDPETETSGSVKNSSASPLPQSVEKKAERTAAAKSGGLQTSSLQAGQLEGAHLSGYPALPNVETTSSILNPSAAQLANKTRLDQITLQRKFFFMEHPSHYYP